MIRTTVAQKLKWVDTVSAKMQKSVKVFENASDTKSENKNRH